MKRNSKGRSQDERKVMPAGGSFYIHNIEIINDSSKEEVGRGGSCLVYYGHITGGNGLISGTKVIIKEFYPNIAGLNRSISREESGRLRISEAIKGMEEYQSRKAQFMQGLHNQKKLSDSQALEIGVKPFIEGEWGDSYYVVSDVHQGVVLSEAQFGTLRERIVVAVKVIECLDILHENGYLMLDMKPENFLWIYKPAMVRILDVDSLINLNKEAGEPERLFRNNRYAAPEIEFLEVKAMEASRQEFFRYYKKMLSPQTGIYMAGIYFFQLFFWKNTGREGRRKFKGRSIGRRIPVSLCTGKGHREGNIKNDRRIIDQSHKEDDNESAEKAVKVSRRSDGRTESDIL